MAPSATITEGNTNIPQNLNISDSGTVEVGKPFDTERFGELGITEMYFNGKYFWVVPSFPIEHSQPRRVHDQLGRGQTTECRVMPFEVPFEVGTSSSKMDTSDPTELVEALLDLYSVRRIAEEEGGTVPEEDAMPRAERVLRAMYQAAQRPYSIYPMPDGDISIDAHGPPGTKVVVVCDPDGGARCHTYISGAIDGREYDDSSVIPDPFIRQALARTQGQTQDLPTTASS